MLSGDLEINAWQHRINHSFSNRHLAQVCLMPSITGDRETQRYRMVCTLVGRQLIHNHINIKYNVRQ